MIMETKQNNKAPYGLTYKAITDRTFLVIDMRDNKERYVGLICNVPFGYGFMLCPFVRKGLRWNIDLKSMPRYFRGSRKACNWMMKHAVGWNTKRKYTRWNFLIKWLAIYGVILYSFLRDNRFHTGIISMVISLLLMFYPTSSKIATIAINTTAAIILILGIINLSLLIHDRKSGLEGGNRTN